MIAAFGLAILVFTVDVFRDGQSPAMLAGTVHQWEGGKLRLPRTNQPMENSGPAAIAQRQPNRAQPDRKTSSRDLFVNAARSNARPETGIEKSTVVRKQDERLARRQGSTLVRPLTTPAPERVSNKTESIDLRSSPGSLPPQPVVEKALELKFENQMNGMQQRIERLAQLQFDQQSRQLEQATQLLQQFKQTTQLENLKKQLEQIEENQKKPSPADKPAESQNADTNLTTSPAKKRNPILKAEPTKNDPELFSLQIQNSDLDEVLEMLGQLSGLNILSSQNVTGTVTANLQNVSIDEALEAILKSNDLEYKAEGKFIYVMSKSEADAKLKSNRKLVVKVYQPKYISAKDIMVLVSPLLTPEIGKVAVTNPNETGITSDSSSAGGDSLAQTDAVLVNDYPEIISEIDAIIAEMDVPPLQVVIDAMILSVKLTDDMAFGVNFALLSGSLDDLAVSGNGSILNSTSGFPNGTAASIIPPAAGFLANSAGLKYGFIRDNVSGFISALETISDTNMIASPQLRVINKQKAELLIGERLAYTTSTFMANQSIETVNFLDVGTKLIIRPFISSDGLVRLEVHPERSSGFIDSRNLPQSTTTEVTTNIMVRDGTTAVIGGLIDEQVEESSGRIPLLGSIPLLGAAFRNKTEKKVRTELIILLTPRIVREPEFSMEAESIKTLNDRRREHFKRELSPINRSNLSRMEFERAEFYFQRGAYLQAHHHVDRCLKISKNDADAIALRDQIEDAIRQRNRSWMKWPWKSKQAAGPILEGEVTENVLVPTWELPPVPADQN